ncbi:isotocin receptor-like [Betta splendens]|uniref:Isotocin receptor-like n=1 Tax=Betta splendens TaxID=158456 RepID=A0A6P7MPF2_BETSP|nr:isotocin receptor-like [Betta splendens]
MDAFLREERERLRNASCCDASRVNDSHAGNSTANPLKRNEDVAKAEVAVLLLVLLLAVTGNLCVLWVVHATKRAQSRMHYFMKHLSIADLVVAFFQVLPQLIWDITFRFYGPDLLCRSVKYLQVVGMFASTYLLVLMSVDRCLAVCRPLRAVAKRTDRTCVLASWMLSLVFSAPQACIFSLKEVGSGVYDCWGDFVQPWGAKAYVTWMSVTIYFVPVAILSVCYGLICLKIWQNFNLKTRRGHVLALTARTSKAPHPLSRVSSVKLISKAKMRTVKMTFVVVLVYIACWTPFFFVQLWSAWDPDAPREDAAFIISMLLASLNSCCNPWIYMLFAGPLFRDGMRCCSRGPARRSTSKTGSSQRSLTHASGAAGPWR